MNKINLFSNNSDSQSNLKESRIQWIVEYITMRVLGDSGTYVQLKIYNLYSSHIIYIET